MPQIAKIAVAAATFAIDKPYDYQVPDDAAVGQRVLVPFGRGNRTSEGLILSLHVGTSIKSVKMIQKLLDVEPVVTERDIRLALWMRQRYFCTFYDAIRTIIPAAVWFRYREIWKMCQAPEEVPDATEKEAAVLSALINGPLETEELIQLSGEASVSLLRQMQKKGMIVSETLSDRTVRDKVVTMAALSCSPEEASGLVQEKTRLGSRQAAAVKFLSAGGNTSLHDLIYYTGVSRPGLLSLEKRGIIRLWEQEEYRVPLITSFVKPDDITLNPDQQRVFEEILAQALSGKSGVTVLEGVTGSGKTLIYIRLAQELLKRGKNVMILVPEIALTPQMMSRFTAYFGDDVALMHSGLKMTERYDQFKRIRRGEVHIVLGTRSAVFAPLENIGLIVLDEEQESSYESENTPCYHARDIAKYRCVQENARLVLGSATPTVETAYHARQGDYQFSQLKHRYNEQKLPDVLIVDMRQELRAGNSSVISHTLAHELQKNIASGQQSILFLNRRGTSRQLLCPSCGYVPQCSRCSVYLTYHSANRRLMCHHCGHSEQAPESCPVCGGILKYVGAGTQKVESDLEKLFPGVGILRMDADSVGSAHETILREFEDQKVPVLLGTQMVAKGLDFENVTLVGVLDADQSLYVDHFRAAERTFSLLTQVVGRAGRGDKTGRAVIQTYTPGNDVIQAAARQDYEQFYENEIRLRSIRRDPPFADQFVMTVTGLEENAVRRACGELAQGLRNISSQPPYSAMELAVFGPAPAPVVKVNNRYRYRVIITGQNNRQLRDLLAAIMKEFSGRKENRSMSIYTECNRMD